MVSGHHYSNSAELGSIKQPQMHQSYMPQLLHKAEWKMHAQEMKTFKPDDTDRNVSSVTIFWNIVVMIIGNDSWFEIIFTDVTSCNEEMLLKKRL